MSAPADPVALPSLRIVQFAGMLREHGLQVGPGEQAAMLRVAELLRLRGAGAISAAWRALTCRQAAHWRQWPELFERFWFAHRTKGTVKLSGHSRPRRSLQALVEDHHKRLEEGAARPSTAAQGSAAHSSALSAAQAPQADDPSRAQGGASRVEALHDREAQFWLPRELGELSRLAAQITQRLRPQPTRRWRSAARGQRIDFRHLFRCGITASSLLPVWKTPRRVPPRIVIAVDVSRSMESHGAFLLRVSRAFARQSGAKVYVFHTRIAEISPLLLSDSPRIQEKVNALASGFGGGTRIAASLERFLHGNHRLSAPRATRLWILSDGFDTDEPAALEMVLRALRGRGVRLDWFHPTRAAPHAQAFRAAAHLLEQCLPLANLADLRALRERIA